LEIVRAAKLGTAASLRISAIFGQPGNVMFLLFYDIIAKVIAAQWFPALALSALARKCHEMCGYVTFCEILGRCHRHLNLTKQRHNLLRAKPLLRHDWLLSKLILSQRLV
jgi:hypothetical protein